METMPVLTMRQYQIYRRLAAGMTTTQAQDDLNCRRDTFYSHQVALRAKGVLSKGEAGKKGSVKVLRKPHEVLVKGERPIDPAWMTTDVRAVVRGIRAGRTDGDLRVLADALEEAGCSDGTLLADLRGRMKPAQVARLLERLVEWA